MTYGSGSSEDTPQPQRRQHGRTFGEGPEASGTRREGQPDGHGVHPHAHHRVRHPGHSGHAGQWRLQRHRLHLLGAGHGRDRPFGRHRGQSHHDRVHGAGHAGGQRRQRFGRAAPGRGKARGRRGQLGEYRILEPGVLCHRGLCRCEPRHSGRAAHAFQRNRRRASLCAGVPADHLLRFRVPVHRHGREQLHPYRRRAEPRVGDHAHRRRGPARRSTTCSFCSWVGAWREALWPPSVARRFRAWRWCGTSSSRRTCRSSCTCGTCGRTCAPSGPSCRWAWPASPCRRARPW